MNEWGKSVGAVLLAGGLAAGAGVTSVSATTWEYATVPLMIHVASKPQADRWGLFVGEWTPTFLAVANSTRTDFAPAAQGRGSVSLAESYADQYTFVHQ